MSWLDIAKTKIENFVGAPVFKKDVVVLDVTMNPVYVSFTNNTNKGAVIRKGWAFKRVGDQPSKVSSLPTLIYESVSPSQDAVVFKRDDCKSVMPVEHNIPPVPKYIANHYRPLYPDYYTLYDLVQAGGTFNDEAVRTALKNVVIKKILPRSVNLLPSEKADKYLSKLLTLIRVLTHHGQLPREVFTNFVEKFQDVGEFLEWSQPLIEHREALRVPPQTDTISALFAMTTHYSFSDSAAQIALLAAMTLQPIFGLTGYLSTKFSEVKIFSSSFNHDANFIERVVNLVWLASKDRKDLISNISVAARKLVDFSISRNPTAALTVLKFWSSLETLVVSTESDPHGEFWTDMLTPRETTILHLVQTEHLQSIDPCVLRVALRCCQKSRLRLAETHFRQIMSVDANHAAAFFSCIAVVLRHYDSPAFTKGLLGVLQDNVRTALPGKVAAHELLLFSMSMNWEFGVNLALKKGTWQSEEALGCITTTTGFPKSMSPNIFDTLIAASISIMGNFSGKFPDLPRALFSDDVLSSSDGNGWPLRFTSTLVVGWLHTITDTKLKRLVDNCATLKDNIDSEYILASLLLLAEVFQRSLDCKDLSTTALSATYCAFISKELTPEKKKIATHIHEGSGLKKLVAERAQGLEDALSSTDNLTYADLLEMKKKIEEVKTMIDSDCAARLEDKLADQLQAWSALRHEYGSLLNEFAAINKLISNFREISNFGLLSTLNHDTNMATYTSVMEKSRNYLLELFGDNLDIFRKVMIHGSSEKKNHYHGEVGYKSVLFTVNAASCFDGPPPWRINSMLEARETFAEVKDRVEHFLNELEDKNLDLHSILKGMVVSDELELLSKCFKIPVNLHVKLQTLLQRFKILSHTFELRDELLALDVINHKEDADLITEIVNLKKLRGKDEDPEIVVEFNKISEVGFEVMRALSAAPNLLRLLVDTYKINTEEGSAALSTKIDEIQNKRGVRDDGSEYLISQLSGAFDLLHTMTQHRRSNNNTKEASAPNNNNNDDDNDDDGPPSSDDGYHFSDHDGDIESIQKVSTFINCLSEVEAHVKNNTAMLQDIAILEQSWGRLNRILAHGSATVTQRSSELLRQIHTRPMVWHTTLDGSYITENNNEILCTKQELADYCQIYTCEKFTEGVLLTASRDLLRLAKHAEAMIIKATQLMSLGHPSYIKGIALQWELQRQKLDSVCEDTEVNNLAMKLDSWKETLSTAFLDHKGALLLPYRYIAHVLSKDPASYVAEANVIAALLGGWSVFNIKKFTDHTWEKNIGISDRLREFCKVVDSCVTSPSYKNARSGDMLVVEYIAPLQNHNNLLQHQNQQQLHPPSNNNNIPTTTFEGMMNSVMCRYERRHPHPFEVLVCTTSTDKQTLLHFLQRPKHFPNCQYSILGAHLLEASLRELVLGVIDEFVQARCAANVMVTVEGTSEDFTCRGWTRVQPHHADGAAAATPYKKKDVDLATIVVGPSGSGKSHFCKTTYDNVKYLPITDIPRLSDVCQFLSDIPTPRQGGVFGGQRDPATTIWIDLSNYAFGADVTSMKPTTHDTIANPDDFTFSIDQGLLLVNDLLHQLVVNRCVVEPSSGLAVAVDPNVTFVIEVSSPTAPPANPAAPHPPVAAGTSYLKKVLPNVSHNCKVISKDTSNLINRLELDKETECIAIFALVCNGAVPPLTNAIFGGGALIGGVDLDELKPFLYFVDPFKARNKITDAMIVDVLKSMILPEHQRSFTSIINWCSVAKCRFSFLFKETFSSWADGCCEIQDCGRGFECGRPDHQHLKKSSKDICTRLWNSLVDDVNRHITVGYTVGLDSASGTFLPDEWGFVLPYWGTHDLKDAPEHMKPLAPLFKSALESCLESNANNIADNNNDVSGMLITLEHKYLSQMVFGVSYETKVKQTHAVLQALKYVITPDNLVRFAFLFEGMLSRQFIVIESSTGVGKTYQLKAIERLRNFSAEQGVRNRIHAELYTQKKVSVIPTCFWTRVFTQLLGKATTANIDPLWMQEKDNGVKYICGVLELLHDNEQRVNAASNQWDWQLPSVLEHEIESLTKQFPLAHWNVPFDTILSQLKDGYVKAPVEELITGLVAPTLASTFQKLLVHPGITEADVNNFLDPIVGLCNLWITSCPETPSMLVVFFDEINTTTIPGYFKMITMDRRFRGKNLPTNLTFFGAINPFGIENEVYAVCDIPESTKCQVRKFSGFTDRDRKSYISRLIAASEGREKVDHLEREFATIIDCAHTFVEKLFIGNPSLYGPPSQRDIQRTLNCKNKILELLLGLTSDPPAVVANKKDPMYLQRRKLHAIVTATYFAYATRLHLHHKEDLIKLCDKQVRNVTQNVLGGRQGMEQIVKTVVSDVVNTKNFELHVGISLTAGLAETLFVELIAVLSTEPKISVGICGKPGCGKTLSVKLLAHNMKGAASPQPFFRTFPVLRVTMLQGSESTTAQQIATIAHWAKKSQRQDPDSLFLVCFDEAGLAGQIKVMKALHEPLDEGIVTFICLSNKPFECAISNRMLVLSREIDTEHDYKSLVSGCLIGNNDNVAAALNTSFKTFVNGLVAALKEIEQHEVFKNRYHNRDAIYLCRFLHATCKPGEGHLITPEALLRGLEYNYSGSSKTETIELFEIFFKAVRKCDGGDTKWTLDTKNLRNVRQLVSESFKREKMSRHMCPRYMLLLDPTDDYSASSNFVAELKQKDHDNDPPRVHEIFVSNFPGDANSMNDAQVIGRIRHYMEQGHHVIVKNGNRILGSLFDVLNQHFDERLIKGKPHFFANVAIGSETHECQIHENFCITFVLRESVARESEVSNSPFLSRHEKYLLPSPTITASSSVNSMESAVATRVAGFVENCVQEQQIVGYNRHFIPSLIRLCLDEEDIGFNQQRRLQEEDHVLSRLSEKTRNVILLNQHLLNVTGASGIALSRMRRRPHYLRSYFAQQEHFSLSRLLLQRRHNNNINNGISNNDKVPFILTKHVLDTRSLIEHSHNILGEDMAKSTAVIPVASFNKCAAFETAIEEAGADDSVVDVLVVIHRHPQTEDMELINKVREIVLFHHQKLNENGKFFSILLVVPRCSNNGFPIIFGQDFHPTFLESLVCSPQASALLQVGCGVDNHNTQPSSNDDGPSSSSNNNSPVVADGNFVDDLVDAFIQENKNKFAAVGVDAAVLASHPSYIPLLDFYKPAVDPQTRFTIVKDVIINCPLFQQKIYETSIKNISPDVIQEALRRAAKDTVGGGGLLPLKFSEYLRSQLNAWGVKLLVQLTSDFGLFSLRADPMLATDSVRALQFEMNEVLVELGKTSGKGLRMTRLPNSPYNPWMLSICAAVIDRASTSPNAAGDDPNINKNNNVIDEVVMRGVDVIRSDPQLFKLFTNLLQTNNEDNEDNNNQWRVDAFIRDAVSAVYSATFSSNEFESDEVVRAVKRECEKSCGFNNNNDVIESEMRVMLFSVALDRFPLSLQEVSGAVFVSMVANTLQLDSSSPSKYAARERTKKAAVNHFIKGACDVIIRADAEGDDGDVVALDALRRFTQAHAAIRSWAALPFSHILDAPTNSLLCAMDVVALLCMDSRIETHPEVIHSLAKKIVSSVVVGDDGCVHGAYSLGMLFHHFLPLLSSSSSADGDNDDDASGILWLHNTPCQQFLEDPLLPTVVFGLGTVDAGREDNDDPSSTSSRLVLGAAVVESIVTRWRDEVFAIDQDEGGQLTMFLHMVIPSLLVLPSEDIAIPTNKSLLVSNIGVAAVLKAVYSSALSSPQSMTVSGIMLLTSSIQECCVGTNGDDDNNILDPHDPHCAHIITLLKHLSNHIAIATLSNLATLHPQMFIDQITDLDEDAPTNILCSEVADHNKNQQGGVKNHRRKNINNENKISQEQHEVITNWFIGALLRSHDQEAVASIASQLLAKAPQHMKWAERFTEVGVLLVHGVRRNLSIIPFLPKFMTAENNINIGNPQWKVYRGMRLALEEGRFNDIMNFDDIGAAANLAPPISYPQATTILMFTAYFDFFEMGKAVQLDGLVAHMRNHNPLKWKCETLFKLLDFIIKPTVALSALATAMGLHGADVAAADGGLLNKVKGASLRFSPDGSVSATSLSLGDFITGATSSGAVDQEDADNNKDAPAAADAAVPCSSKEAVQIRRVLIHLWINLTAPLAGDEAANPAPTHPLQYMLVGDPSALRGTYAFGDSFSQHLIHGFDCGAQYEPETGKSLSGPLGAFASLGDKYVGHFSVYASLLGYVLFNPTKIPTLLETCVTNTAVESAPIVQLWKSIHPNNHNAPPAPAANNNKVLTTRIVLVTLQQIMQIFDFLGRFAGDITPQEAPILLTTLYTNIVSDSHLNKPVFQVFEERNTAEQEFVARVGRSRVQCKRGLEIAGQHDDTFTHAAKNSPVALVEVPLRIAPISHDADVLASLIIKNSSLIQPLSSLLALYSLLATKLDGKKMSTLGTLGELHNIIPGCEAVVQDGIRGWNALCKASNNSFVVGACGNEGQVDLITSGHSVKDFLSVDGEDGELLGAISFQFKCIKAVHDAIDAALSAHVPTQTLTYIQWIKDIPDSVNHAIMWALPLKAGALSNTLGMYVKYSAADGRNTDVGNAQAILHVLGLMFRGGLLIRPDEATIDKIRRQVKFAPEKAPRHNLGDDDEDEDGGEDIINNLFLESQSTDLRLPRTFLEDLSSCGVERIRDLLSALQRLKSTLIADKVPLQDTPFSYISSLPAFEKFVEVLASLSENSGGATVSAAVVVKCGDLLQVIDAVKAEYERYTEGHYLSDAIARFAESTVCCIPINEDEIREIIAHNAVDTPTNRTTPEVLLTIMEGARDACDEVRGLARNFPDKKKSINANSPNSLLKSLPNSVTIEHAAFIHAELERLIGRCTCLRVDRTTSDYKEEGSEDDNDNDDDIVDMMANMPLPPNHMSMMTRDDDIDEVVKSQQQQHLDLHDHFEDLGVAELGDAIDDSTCDDLLAPAANQKIQSISSSPTIVRSVHVDPAAVVPTGYNSNIPKQPSQHPSSSSLSVPTSEPPPDVALPKPIQVDTSGGGDAPAADNDVASLLKHRRLINPTSTTAVSGSIDEEGKGSDSVEDTLEVTFHALKDLLAAIVSATNARGDNQDNNNSVISSSSSFLRRLRDNAAMSDGSSIIVRKCVSDTWEVDELPEHIIENPQSNIDVAQFEQQHVADDSDSDHNLHAISATGMPFLKKISSKTRPLPTVYLLPESQLLLIVAIMPDGTLIERWVHRDVTLSAYATELYASFGKGVKAPYGPQSTLYFSLYHEDTSSPSSSDGQQGLTNGGGGSLILDPSLKASDLPLNTRLCIEFIDESLPRHIVSARKKSAPLEGGDVPPAYFLASLPIGRMLDVCEVGVSPTTFDGIGGASSSSVGPRLSDPVSKLTSTSNVVLSLPVLRRKCIFVNVPSSVVQGNLIQNTNLRRCGGSATSSWFCLPIRKDSDGDEIALLSALLLHHHDHPQQQQLHYALRPFIQDESPPILKAWVDEEEDVLWSESRPCFTDGQHLTLWEICIVPLIKKKKNCPTHHIAVFVNPDRRHEVTVEDIIKAIGPHTGLKPDQPMMFFKDGREITTTSASTTTLLIGSCSSSRIAVHEMDVVDAANKTICLKDEGGVTSRFLDSTPLSIISDYYLINTGGGTSSSSGTATTTMPSSQQNVLLFGGLSLATDFPLLPVGYLRHEAFNIGFKTGVAAAAASSPLSNTAASMSSSSPYSSTLNRSTTATAAASASLFADSDDDDYDIVEGVSSSPPAPQQPSINITMSDVDDTEVRSIAFSTSALQEFLNNNGRKVFATSSSTTNNDDNECVVVTPLISPSITTTTHPSFRCTKGKTLTAAPLRFMMTVLYSMTDRVSQSLNFTQPKPSSSTADLCEYSVSTTTNTTSAIAACTPNLFAYHNDSVNTKASSGRGDVDSSDNTATTITSSTLLVSTAVSAKSDTLRDAAMAAARYTRHYIHDDSHCVCVLLAAQVGEGERSSTTSEGHDHLEHQQPMCSLDSDLVQTTLASKGQIWVASSSSSSV